LYPDSRVILWTKPAADNVVKRIDMPVIHDVCFVANGGQAKIKNIKWVYKTAPSDLKILHLGFPSKHKPPKNIFRKRVPRIAIAEEMCKCKIGIVPYSSYDSAPRVVPEMLSCGLPIIALRETRANFFGYRNGDNVTVVPKMAFWDFVQTCLNGWDPAWKIDIAESYLERNSMKVCTVKLRGMIEEELIKKERIFHVKRTAE